MKGSSRKNVTVALVLAGLAFVLLFVFFGVGLAAEGGGHGAAAAHDGSARMVDLLYRVLNFGLLVIILAVVVKKSAMTGFFSARREEIKNRLDALKQGKEQSERRYLELEKKLKEFEASKAEIVEQFKAEGLAEKERIIAQAKERVQQILAQADLTIEREIQAARNRLKQEIVDAAAAKAQELVVQKIGERDQDQLVNDFIAKVEKLH